MNRSTGESLDLSSFCKSYTAFCPQFLQDSENHCLLCCVLQRAFSDQMQLTCPTTELLPSVALLLLHFARSHFPAYSIPCAPVVYLPGVRFRHSIPPPLQKPSGILQQIHSTHRCNFRSTQILNGKLLGYPSSLGTFLQCYNVFSVFSESFLSEFECFVETHLMTKFLTQKGLRTKNVIQTHFSVCQEV